VKVICCPESWSNIAPRDELGALVDVLGDDEVRVLARIAGRLVRGQDIYGRLDLAQDARQFDTEAREEVEDCLVYLACRWLRDRA
jgi:hypothetical protein